MFKVSRLKVSVFRFGSLDSVRVARALVFALLITIFFTAWGSLAQAQDFKLEALEQLHPVNFGGSSTAVLELTALDTNGQSETVTFTCAVTPVQTTGTPACLVSPSSQIPGTQGAQISVTVTTSETTPPGTYQIVVTGTSVSTTVPVSLTLGVTPLSEDYTLSVLPTTATPNPVKAGSVATTTVTVTPIGSYSGHTVTLSCLTVSPTVLQAPVCSFSPAAVNVTGGTPPTSILSITSIGPPPSSRLNGPRIFYALWLVIPGIGLVGLASSGGSRRKKAISAFLLLIVAGSLLFLPACGSSSSNSSGSTQTPQNSYTFTLSGADENGAAPSNTTTNAATVTVTVN